ncbi:MAG: hypothetical protein GY765_04190, partial [bacterium]|nr:hypothetical protein [bacterium]
VSSYNDEIAITGRTKLIFVSGKLKYIREIKLKERFEQFVVTRKREIYRYNAYYHENYYFSVCNMNFKFLRAAGVITPGAKPKKKKLNDFSLSWNLINNALYIPKDNSIWVTYMNRYDLRCYRDGKAIVDIKSRSKLFSTADARFSGVSVKRYTDRSVAIGRNGNKLYNCIRLGKDMYCDIFDLSGGCRLVSRLKFPWRYRRLAFHKDSTFYGIRFDDEENPLLDKIQLMK